MCTCFKFISVIEGNVKVGVLWRHWEGQQPIMVSLTALTFPHASHIFSNFKNVYYF